MRSRSNLTFPRTWCFFNSTSSRIIQKSWHIRLTWLVALENRYTIFHYRGETQDLGRGDGWSSEIVYKVFIFESGLMCGDNFSCEIWETLIFLFFPRLVQWLDLPFDPERSECHQRVETSIISGRSSQHTQESGWIARWSISQFMN